MPINIDVDIGSNANVSENNDEINNNCAIQEVSIVDSVIKMFLAYLVNITFVLKLWNNLKIPWIFLKFAKLTAAGLFTFANFCLSLICVFAKICFEAFDIRLKLIES